MARIIEKNYKKYYQDIFTKTLYDDYCSVRNVEDIGTCQIRPVVSPPRPYIMHKEAIKLYRNLNVNLDELLKDSKKSNKSLQNCKKH